MFLGFDLLQPYGCCIAFGIIAALGVNIFLTAKKKLDFPTERVLLDTYIGAFVCGKLFFLLENFFIYFTSAVILNMSDFFNLITGGFCVLGASFGGILGMSYAISKSPAIKKEGGMLPLSILLIHIFGRLGCWYGGCCDGLCMGYSLYPIVMGYYAVFFFLGWIGYQIRKLNSFDNGIRYYAMIVFFERFIFDLCRDDVIFFYFPIISYYHIVSCIYLAAVFIFMHYYNH